MSLLYNLGLKRSHEERSLASYGKHILYYIELFLFPSILNFRQMYILVLRAEASELLLSHVKFCFGQPWMLLVYKKALYEL